MAEFSVFTDYKNKSIWNISDSSGVNLKATGVGALAAIGSKMGEGLSVQISALKEMVDNLVSLRDNSAHFTVANYPSMAIVSGKILPPVSVDVSQLVEMGIDLYSPSANQADIDKLVRLESWIEQTFGDSSSSAAKITYRIPGMSSDSWIVLNDAFPILVLPSGSLPSSSSGGLALNKLFSYPGQTETFMMVQALDCSAVKATVSGISKVFSKVASVKEYQDYIENLALNRSQYSTKTLDDDGISNVPYDAIAWRKVNEIDYRYSKLPVISIESTRLPNAVYPVGSLLRTEKGEYFYIVSPKSSDKDAVTEKIEIGNSYLISPDDISLSSIRAQYGDQITISTQVSAKQELFVNELMQKYQLHFDAASNFLKAFSDLVNRISSQI